MFIVYYRFDLVKSSILFFHIVTIFLLNYVLFSPSYMPDQINYLYIAKGIRGSLILPEELLTPTGITGTFYAFFPMPFMNSVYSVAMINFILYLFVLWCLGKWKMFNNKTVFFALIYPSLLFYSSVGLREIIVLTLMIYSVHLFAVQEKMFLAFVVAIPLMFFRIQNFAIVTMSFFIYTLLSGKVNIRKVVYIVLAILFFLLIKDIKISRFTLGEFYTLEKLEFFRSAFYNEELRIGKEAIYRPITSMLDFIWITITSFIYMLFKPFPWESSNILQLIQSFENLVIVAMIFWVNKVRIYNKVIRKKVLFLNIFLTVSMTVYGLVVFNFGSASRYRFSFLAIYFLFYYYFIYQDNLSFQTKFHSEKDNFLNSETFSSTA